MGLMGLTESWNRFLRKMLEAKKEWKRHQELLGNSTRAEIECQPVEAQRVLGMYEKMDFEVMLGNFAFFCLTSGGMEGLLVGKIVEREVKEDGRK